MSEQSENAIQAINSLRSAVLQGDENAAKELVKIGNLVAGYISALTRHPLGSKSRHAIGKAVLESESWPVTVGAMQEYRKPIIPKDLGGNLPFKTKGRRDLDYDTRTGFAKSTYDDMKQVMFVPELTSETIDSVIESAFQFLTESCEGRFEEFPWPDKLDQDAEARLGESANKETALRYAVKEWLKYGLKQLVK